MWGKWRMHVFCAYSLFMHQAAGVLPIDVRPNLQWCCSITGHLISCGKRDIRKIFIIINFHQEWINNFPHSILFSSFSLSILFPLHLTLFLFLPHASGFFSHTNKISCSPSRPLFRHTHTHTHTHTCTEKQWGMKSLSALIGDVPAISTALQGNNMTAKQTTPLVILNTTCKSTLCVCVCVLGGGVMQCVCVLVCFNRLFAPQLQAVENVNHTDDWQCMMSAHTHTYTHTNTHIDTVQEFYTLLMFCWT